MSNIKKLLEEVEVEWKTLDKVAKIKNGKDWKQLKEGNIPVYGSGGIMAYVNTFTYNRPTVLIPRKGSITNIFYVETPMWNVDTIYYTEIDTDIIVPKYFYYYLKTLDLMKLDTGSGRPSLTQAILNQIMIPIPCPNDPEKSLEIQQEIVRILDKFSTLTAELQAELQARKSQYEYYRNQLLTYPMEESDQLSLRSSRSTTSIQSSDSPTQPLSTLNPHTGNSVLQPRGKVEWIPLDKVAKIKNGKDWKQLKEGNIPVYGSGGIMAYVNTFTYNKPTVLIPRKGSITNIFYVETPMWNVDTIYYTEIDTDIIVPKYFYYYLKTLDLMKLDTGSGRPSLTQAILNQIMIPIPYPNDTEKSLKEQERIVAILDKFDTITTSITEGLPKEIELRQKQYEYYRDMLLSFPKNNIKA